MFSEADTTAILKAKQELQNLIGICEVFNWYPKVGQKMARLPNEDIENVVIAGGVISSILRCEKHNDIDVFLLNDGKRNPRSTLDMLMNHKKGKWTVRFRDPEYNNKGKIGMTAYNDATRVQYILTDLTTRKELLEHFDYLHCTASYVPVENKLYITPETYIAIRNKFLIVNNPDSIVSHRTEKFHKRGWRDCDPAILHEQDDRVDHLIKVNKDILFSEEIDELDKALEELLK